MTELPELPRQHKKPEADFGIQFRAYMEKNGHLFPDCTFEIKKTATNSFPFSHLEPKQEIYGRAIMFNDSGVLIRVQGMNGEPDYNFYRRATAYIVIKYPKGFVGITIFNFLAEREINERKSLLYSRAVKIASFCG